MKQLQDYESSGGVAALVTGPVGPYPLRFLAESPFPIEFYKLGQVTVEHLQVIFPMPGTYPTAGNVRAHDQESQPVVQATGYTDHLSMPSVEEVARAPRNQ